MAKEIELNDWKDVIKFMEEFDKIYNVKTILLLGRESGCRRIDLE